MLYEIEFATTELLKMKILEAKEIKVGPEGSTISKPSIHTACQAGLFSKVTDKSWKCDIEVNVYVLFQHFGNDDKRRQGMSRILWGVFTYLAGKKLGLDITGMQPKEFRDVTDPDIVGEGDLLYRLQFSTKAELKAESEEEAGELLAIGLQYYLQDPVDDGRADAADEITLGGGNT
jgi:hypothetical protein